MPGSVMERGFFSASRELSRFVDYVAQIARSGPVIDVGVTRHVLPDALRARGLSAWPADDLAAAVSIARQHGCYLVVAVGFGDGLDGKQFRAAMTTLITLGPQVLVGPFHDDVSRPLGPAGLILCVRADTDIDHACDVQVLRRELAERDRRVVELTGRLLAMEATLTWRLRRRMESMAARSPLSWLMRSALYLGRRAIEVWLDEGVAGVVQKTAAKVRLGRGLLPPSRSDELDAQYARWLRRQRLSARRLRREYLGQNSFRTWPLISVVIAADGSQPDSLNATIASVHRQIYPRWQLLVASGGMESGWPELPANDGAGSTPAQLAVRPRLADLLQRAKGEFIGFLAPGSQLSEWALLEVVRRLNTGVAPDVVYADEDEVDEQGRQRRPFFKPGWSPDLLLSIDYVSRFCIFRRELFEQACSAKDEIDVADRYDLVLRLTEAAESVAHIPKVLSHRRVGQPVSSPEAERRAVERALTRRGREATVWSIAPGSMPHHHRVVRYPLRVRPLVSIIIPTRDQVDLLRQCLRSIADRTDYDRYEILIVDNDSREPETLRFLAQVSATARVVHCPGAFNYSAINNLGVNYARGEQLLFLNNDVQVIAREWLTAMVEHAQRPEVGAVGAKLLYPDGTIQHGGVVLGIRGMAGHAFRHQPDEAEGYQGLAHVTRNCSAVTAACLLIRRAVFEEVGGFDEALRVDLNDIDLCLRIRRRGYLIVYTPLARLYHYEGASRRRLRPAHDERLFRTRWRKVLESGDPYYNPNLTRFAEDWSLAV
ncbi:MAG TPA: glycosyltransferase family 2 protein [Dehalococcoidia bacterium]|nr:glycosyltransferase family 2 protein [Dehalococcoidia bacterium]